MLNIMSVFSGLFGFVFMITGGGPGYDTTVLEYLLYVKAFKLHDMGYAAALSVVLFGIVVIVTLLQRKITNAGEEADV
jgi:ABC-type sugar transport system permease subunit